MKHKLWQFQFQVIIWICIFNFSCNYIFASIFYDSLNIIYRGYFCKLKQDNINDCFTQKAVSMVVRHFTLIKKWYIGGEHLKVLLWRIRFSGYPVLLNTAVDLRNGCTFFSTRNKKKVYYKGLKKDLCHVLRANAEKT